MSPPEVEGFGAGFADSSGFAGAAPMGFTAATGFPAVFGTGLGAFAEAEADADADADARGPALAVGERGGTLSLITAFGCESIGGGAFFALVVLGGPFVAGVPVCDGPRPIPRATTPAATAHSAARPAIIFPFFFFAGSGAAGTALPESLRESEGSGVAWFTVDASSVGVGARFEIVGLEGSGVGTLRSPDESVITPDGGRLTTPLKASRSPSARLFAFANRSAGSRAHALANHASNETGSAGSTDEGRAGVPVAIFTASAPNDGPSNGRCPVSASNVTTPSAQRSLRASIDFCAVTCSGLM
jgi:hypothetical protein